MQESQNYKLKLPEGFDNVKRQDFVDNFNIIDKTMKDNADNISQLSNPNLLINGDFQIWQRGTSFLNVNTYAKYTADRWRIDVNNGSVASVEKHDEGLKYTVVTNSDFPPLLVQEIEISSNMRGKKMSFSASFGEVSGNFVINLQHYTNGNHNPVYSNYITSNGTYTVTAEIPSNVEKLYVIIGSNFTTTNGSYFIIKNAKLEYGSVATPFIPRLYGEELALCQRYYQVYKTSITVPRYDIGDLVYTLLFSKMRTIPTISCDVQGWNGTNGIKLESFTIDMKSDVSCRIRYANPNKAYHWYDIYNVVLDAEIY